MPQWWTRTRKAATETDIRFMMLLCLGTEASYVSILSAHSGKKPLSICKILLKSASFQRLISPLILGKVPCHIGFSADQIQCLRSGLKRHFGLSTKQTIGIKDWASTLVIAMGSHRFLSALANADHIKSPKVIMDALIHASTSPNKMVGAIEDLTANSISGYAYRTGGSDETLLLDIYINEKHVGSCPADGLRRDVQEQHGGNGLCGFTLPFALPDDLGESHTVIVNVFEKESGQAVAPAKEMERVGPRRIHYIPRLIQTLETLRETEGDNSAEILSALEQIQKNLPTIEQFSASPLVSYPDYYRLLCAPSPPIRDGAQVTTAIINPKSIWSGDALPDADLYLIVDDGWTITDDASAWAQAAAIDNPSAQVFFTDHDEIDTQGYHRNPWFKAKFDYEFLLAQSGYAQAYAIRSTALASLGALSDLSKTAPHNDIWLRLYEQLAGDAFCHIPQMLWHADMPIKRTPPEALRLVTTSHLARVGGGSVQPHTDPHGGNQPDLLSVEWPLDPALPKLAIIIPTRDRLELTRACVESLQKTLAHPDQTEIIIINNDSQEPEMLAWLEGLRQSSQQPAGVSVLDYNGPFNWADMNNRAVVETDAPYLLFLNNDMLALDHGWDARLRGQLNRPEIGTVGARLLFEDRTIQFAGYIMNPEHIALKDEYGQSPIGGGYKNRSQLPHATSALIGAFIGCRRDVFDAVDGFDSEKFAVAFNDIDFSLRVSDQGLKNLYDPSMTLLHFESKSRGYDHQDPTKTAREQTERGMMQTQHKSHLQTDKHYPDAFLAFEPTFSMLTMPKPKNNA
jgi:GT2 family glycosyltransferase